MTQVCVIFGAGEYYAGTPVVPAGAYVIAADGGLDHTRQLGIVPDVVVGDFDSLEGRPPRTDVRTIALPALKDDPDMLSALKVGWSAGCREFHVYGGLGLVPAAPREEYGEQPRDKEKSVHTGMFYTLAGAKNVP